MKSLLKKSTFALTLVLFMSSCAKKMEEIQMNEEKIIIGTAYPLNGLLTIPQVGDAPYPAVVLVHGSGASDMNEKVGNNRPFRDLAEGLARHGIATIRYDKRPYAHGRELAKSGKLAEFTVKEEYIEDVVFAADLLRKDPRIDPERIFVLGHSLGGMLAPRIDAEGGNFAGLIIWAGSPRTLAEVLMEQQDEIAKTGNFFMRWLVNRQIKKTRELFHRMYDMTDEEAIATPLFGKHNTVYYWKEMGEKPAINYLTDLLKPIIVMHPSDDFHVSIERDFEKYKEILANHPNATFKLYPNLNHLFMPSIYGDINKARKEYKKAQKVEEYVINDIADWIKNN